MHKAFSTPVHPHPTNLDLLPKPKPNPPGSHIPGWTAPKPSTDWGGSAYAYTHTILAEDYTPALPSPTTPTMPTIPPTPPPQATTEPTPTRKVGYVILARNRVRSVTVGSAALVQTFDASPYRGQYVAFRARAMYAPPPPPIHPIANVVAAGGIRPRMGRRRSFLITAASARHMMAAQEEEKESGHRLHAARAALATLSALSPENKEEDAVGHAISAGGVWIRIDVRGRPIRVAGLNWQVSPYLEPAAPSADLLVIAQVPEDALYITLGMALVPASYDAAHGEPRVRFEGLGFRAFGLARHLSVPPLPLNEVQLLNLTVLAHVYTAIRFFHPSDECAATPWNEILHDALLSALMAITPTRLARSLDAIFAPLAPTLQLYVDTPQEAMTTNLGLVQGGPPPVDAVRWRHHGVAERSLLVPLGARTELPLWSSARVLRSLTLAVPPFSALLAQHVDAGPFAGKPFVFEAYLASAGRVAAHMLVSVITSSGAVVCLESMADHPVAGDSPFAEYKIQGAVPPDAVVLVIGFRIKGIGRVELLNPNFSVPETSVTLPAAGSDYFVNLDMNAPLDPVSGLPPGWDFAPSNPSSLSGVVYDFSTETVAGGGQTFVDICIALAVPTATETATATETTTATAPAWLSHFDPSDEASHYLVEDMGRGIGMALPTVLYLDDSGFTLPRGRPSDDDDNDDTPLDDDDDTPLDDAASLDEDDDADAPDFAYDDIEDTVDQNATFDIRMGGVELFLPSASSLFARLSIVIQMWTTLTTFSPTVKAKWGPEPMFSVEWRRVLTNSLLDAATDETVEAFLDTLRHTVHLIGDGQASVTHISQDERRYVLPFQWAWVDSSLIVTHVYAEYEESARVRVGDVIVEVEGVPSPELLQELAVYVSAGSKEHMVRRVLSELSLGEKDQPLTLKVVREGVQSSFTVRVARQVELTHDRTHRPALTWEGSIAVVDTSVVTEGVWTTWMEEGTLAEADGVVLDLTRAPRVQLGFTLASFVSREEHPDGVWSPPLAFPSPCSLRDTSTTLSSWPMCSGQYQGVLAGVPLAVACEAGVVGPAELALTMVRRCGIGLIVSDGPSGGCIGPVVDLDLMGGFKLSFTGAAFVEGGVIDPDVLVDRRTQSCVAAAVATLGHHS